MAHRDFFGSLEKALVPGAQIGLQERRTKAFLGVKERKFKLEERKFEQTEDRLILDAMQKLSDVDPNLPIGQREFAIKGYVDFMEDRKPGSIPGGTKNSVIRFMIDEPGPNQKLKQLIIDQQIPGITEDVLDACIRGTKDDLCKTLFAIGREKHKSDVVIKAMSMMKTENLTHATPQSLLSMEGFTDEEKRTLAGLLQTKTGRETFGIRAEEKSLERMGAEARAKDKPPEQIEKEATFRARGAAEGKPEDVTTPEERLEQIRKDFLRIRSQGGLLGRKLLSEESRWGELAAIHGIGEVNRFRTTLGLGPVTLSKGPKGEPLGIDISEIPDDEELIKMVERDEITREQAIELRKKRDQ